MKTITKLFASMLFAAAGASSQQAFAAPQFGQCAALPGTDNSVSGGCNILITNTNAGLSVAVDSKAVGFGGEDSFVGVVNTASTPLYSLTLSSSLDIFGFDADGTLTFRPGVTNSDYAPVGITFSRISADFTSGTVNFAGGLAPGAFAAFELEENLSAAGLAPRVVTGPRGTVPEPASIALLGLGFLGFVGARRKASR